MKKKDLMFYTVLILSLSVFVLPPLAYQFAVGENVPGFALLLEWIKAGEQFVLSRN